LAGIPNRYLIAIEALTLKKVPVLAAVQV